MRTISPPLNSSGAPDERLHAKPYTFTTPPLPPRRSDAYPGVYKEDGEPCAVKVINRKPLKNAEVLAQEVVILRSLDHPQVVR